MEQDFPAGRPAVPRIQAVTPEGGRRGKWGKAEAPHGRAGPAPGEGKT